MRQANSLLGECFLRRIEELSLIICICLFTFNLKAQSIANLDHANGFKEFKLGMSKSNWAHYLNLADTKVKNTYIYAGACCQTAFGFHVGRILLSFDQSDRLISIMIMLRDRQQGRGQEGVQNAIESAFGRSSNIDVRYGGDINIQWVGEKATLTMLNNYRGAVNGGWEICLWYVEAKEMSKINPLMGDY